MTLLETLVKVQIQQFGFYWTERKRKEGNGLFKVNQAKQTWVDMRLNGQGKNQMGNGYCVHVS